MGWSGSVILSSVSGSQAQNAPGTVNRCTVSLSTETGPPRRLISAALCEHGRLVQAFALVVGTGEVHAIASPRGDFQFSHPYLNGTALQGRTAELLSGDDAKAHGVRKRWRHLFI